MSAAVHNSLTSHSAKELPHAQDQLRPRVEGSDSVCSLAMLQELLYCLTACVLVQRATRRSLLEEALLPQAIPKGRQHQLHCRWGGVVTHQAHTPHLQERQTKKHIMGDVRGLLSRKPHKAFLAAYDGMKLKGTSNVGPRSLTAHAPTAGRPSGAQPGKPLRKLEAPATR